MLPSRAVYGWPSCYRPKSLLLNSPIFSAARGIPSLLQQEYRPAAGMATIPLNKKDFGLISYSGQDTKRSKELCQHRLKILARPENGLYIDFIFYNFQISRENSRQACSGFVSDNSELATFADSRSARRRYLMDQFYRWSLLPWGGPHKMPPIEVAGLRITR